jgi:hypothetical protein
MHLLADNEITLQLTNPNDTERRPQSRLIVNGSPSELIITGAILEAGFKVFDYYLLFLTNDIPNEDSLNIYLIDPQLNLLDWVCLGAAYSTGAFVLREVLANQVVTFNFFDEVLWRLQVFEQSQWHLPFFSDPKGVSRELGLHTYLNLETSVES